MSKFIHILMHIIHCFYYSVHLSPAVQRHMAIHSPDQTSSARGHDTLTYGEMPSGDRAYALDLTRVEN